MARYIDADALKIDYGFTWDDITPTHDEMYALIDRQPTADVHENVLTDDEIRTLLDISRQKYELSEQIKWERDIAVKQLEELGYGLGQEIVHCKDCKHRNTDECPMYYEEWIEYDEGDGFIERDFILHDRTVDDGFCFKGDRRTDE